MPSKEAMSIIDRFCTEFISLDIPYYMREPMTTIIDEEFKNKNEYIKYVARCISLQTIPLWFDEFVNHFMKGDK